MAEVTRDQVVDFLSNLPVIQIAELVKELETKWGVSAAPVAVAAAGGGGAAAAAPAAAAAAAAPAAAEEEQTEFTLVLKAADPAKKIGVIKVVREFTGLGLKEAKDAVDGAPKELKEGLTKAEAATWKQKLEEAGGTVELK